MDLKRCLILLCLLTAAAFGALQVAGRAAALLTNAKTVAANSFQLDTLNPPQAVIVGYSSNTVSWVATTDTYASGHRVFRAASSGGPFTQIAQVTPRTTTTYADSPGPGTFYYVVRSYFQSWESADSSESNTGALRIATGSYVGNATDNRAITGVGFQPDIVFVKCSCGQLAAVRTSSMAGDATKVISNSGALQADHVQSLDPDGFTVGASLQVNDNFCSGCGQQVRRPGRGA